MKLEIDIPDEELKALLKQRVMELASNAIRGSDISWRINETIKSSWHTEIEAMVKKMLNEMEETRIDVPIHFLPEGARTSACGVVNPKLSASMAANVDCLNCRKTELFRAYA